MANDNISHGSDPMKDALAKEPKQKDMEQGPEPSGYKGENPATPGPGPTELISNTPENLAGHLNPSAPGNAGTTPNTTGDK